MCDADTYHVENSRKRPRRQLSRLRALGLLSVLATILFAMSAANVVGQSSPEFRGLWVDAWNDDLWSAQGVARIVDDLRAGNMNAVIPQVRRRGDALYNSSIEPKSHSIATQFDPLGELLARAHDTNAGPRIEVHAWLVTYHVWTASSQYPLPPQPNHVVNAHPDWLLKNTAGSTLIGGQYTLDPGHPAAQQHTFDVCMDIIRNYDVDGLNFDYIRYSSADEGYNAVSLARFRRLYNRSGTPQPEDPQWKQFRRDQVTALLRKIYLHAVELKPWIKISCDTITWSPAPVDVPSWYASSAAWNSVLQDWRGWMQEGILDLNIPMNYFRQTVPAHAMAYTNWSNFAKNQRYNRHVAIGPGIYLNSIGDSIRQLRQARQAPAGGRAADGMVGYSFRVTNTNNLPRAAFLQALVSRTAHDPQPMPVFAEPAATPDMPWKSAPTRGHVKGFVVGESGAVLDGAVVTVQGPVSRAQTNDGTGFYGFVDLPPGSYVARASFPGYSTVTNVVEISQGAVSNMQFTLSAINPLLKSISANAGRVLLEGSTMGGPVAIDWTSNFAEWHSFTNVTASSNSFRVLDGTTQRQKYYRVRRGGQ